MFQTSEKTDLIDDAIAKTQAEIGAAIKDKQNPAFRSDYSSYDSVLEACRPALVKNGIALTQWPIHSSDGRVHLLTRLALKGQWIHCIFSISLDKQNAHGYASAITYLKRFCLSAILGIPSEHEDEGNLAAGVYNAPQKHATTPPSQPPSQRPVVPPETKVKSDAPVASKGFDSKNKEHVDKLFAELKRLNIKGQWQTNVISAMAGKSFTDIEKIIKASNPEAPDSGPE
jgi:hypothetical protein